MTMMFTALRPTLMRPVGSSLRQVRLLSSSGLRRHKRATTKVRNWKGSSSGSSQQQKQAHPGGIPTYLLVTAAGTTAFLGYSYYSNLDSVPLTGRTRWLATSPQWEQQLGDDEYKNLLKSFQSQQAVLPPSHPASVTVKRVGSRLAVAAKEFCDEHQLQISKQPFTYTVVRAEQANAFVLPGNHIFVMTGLFQFVHTEDELAAVLGHEMSHNLARHAGEKISGSFLVSLFARLSLIWDPSGTVYTILIPAASVFRELPNSRTQETEADQLGVHLAARACYDPRAAAQVFRNMKNGSSGAQPPAFLSTHPSHDSRIAKFDEWMPDAMKDYDRGACRHVRHEMSRARQEAASRQWAHEG